MARNLSRLFPVLSASAFFPTMSMEFEKHNCREVLYTSDYTGKGTAGFPVYTDVTLSALREALYTPKGLPEINCIFNGGEGCSVFNTYTESTQDSTSVAELVDLASFAVLLLSPAALFFRFNKRIIHGLYSKLLVGIQRLEFKDYLVLTLSVITLAYMMYSDRAREVLEKERARISQSLQALSLSEVEEIRKQAQAIVKIFKGGDEEESGDGEPGEEARGDSADGEGVEGGSGDGETGEEAREDSADGQGVEVGSGDDEAGEEARGDSADGQGVKVVSGDDEAGEEARGDSAVGEGVHD